MRVMRNHRDPLARMHTMSKRQGKSGTIDIKAVLAEDEEFLRGLVRTALQEVLEAEMTEALSAEKGERTAGRLGYRSGYYDRTLITRVGKLELRVPQDRAGRFSIKDVPLCDEIVPLDAKSAPMMGSTDVGDVSWVVPTVQARGATYAIGTPGHSWQLTAQGKTPAAHKGLVHVAKVMACTAVDVLQDDMLLARAKADHQARVGRMPYVCPLPDELDPPLKMSA